MRASVIKGDPGYVECAFDYKVFLNGEKLDHCFTADEEEGIAYCYETDSKGRRILTDGGEDVKTVKMTGDVCILHPTKGNICMPK